MIESQQVIAWYSIYGLAGVGLAAIASVLCAPFAGLICWVIASGQGSSRRLRHAGIGAFYCLFLILPWFYYLARIQQAAHIPKYLVGIGMVLTYVVWVATSIALLSLGAGVLPDNLDDRSYRPDAAAPFFICIGTFILTVSLNVVAYTELIRSRALREGLHLIPFGFTSFWALYIIVRLFILEGTSFLG